MKKMFIVQHLGYPTAGRAIRPDEWRTYSTHATESAAWKRVAKATAHLESGQWDDHYRVIFVARTAGQMVLCDRYQYVVRSETNRANALEKRDLRAKNRRRIK